MTMTTMTMTMIDFAVSCDDDDDNDEAHDNDDDAEIDDDEVMIAMSTIVNIKEWVAKSSEGHLGTLPMGGFRGRDDQEMAVIRSMEHVVDRPQRERNEREREREG